MSNEKAVIYQTHWKQFYTEYVVAFALTPLLVGFYLLWKLKKKRENHVWHIYNDRVERRYPDEGKTETFYLKNLESVSREVDDKQKKHGLADVILDSGDRQMCITGITEAGSLEDVMVIALENMKRNQVMKAKAEGDYPEFEIGGLEHMNSLVGMWKEGLISDEDFEREKQKFVRNNK